MEYDVIIIGGGVAGLMCANILNKHKVLVIEKKKLGTKLLLTGGGRCNITSNIDNNLFLNNIYNKKYMYSAINLFGPKEVYNYFSKIGLKIEGTKVFPKSNSASTILECLNDVNYIVDTVTNIRENTVYTSENEYKAKKIVVAIGGHSYKHTGCGDIYNFSSFLKQPMTNLYPVEGTLISSGTSELAGTTLESVRIKAGKHISTGNFMFTHKGFSGSSVMDICEHVARNDIKQIEVDFSNNTYSKKFSSYINDDHIRLYDVKCCDIDRAFVTGGGFDLKFINTKTFESKINNNIYFIGECIDVHGPIGGYNITLALSSAYSCAYYINEELLK